MNKTLTQNPLLVFRFFIYYPLTFFVFFLACSPSFLLGSPDTYTHEQLKKRLAELRDESLETRTYETLVSLFFDKKHLSEVLARVSYNEEPPRFRFRTLKKLLANKINPESMVLLGEAQDLTGWVSLEALDDYNPTFNQETLIIHLTTPPEERGDGVIDLQKRAQIDLKDALEPAPFSAYLNFYNMFVYEDNNDNNNHNTYRLNMEGAVHSRPWVVESRFEMKPNEDKTFDYNNLRAIRDYTGKLTRLTLGETQSFRPRILSSDRIQGIKYSTEYDLHPNLVTEPISEYSFLLQRDSTVEIWVNDAHVDTRRLIAGPYDITNFPLQIGLNKIVLKITDDLGREQTLTFDSIKGSNLLAPGKSEFAYSAGVRGSGDRYDGDPILSAFYRQGFTDTFTGTGECRFDPDHFGVGVGCDFACSWFSASATIGGSRAKIASGTVYGTATRLVVTRHFKNFSLSFRSDARHRKYLIQNQKFRDTRIRTLNELSAVIPRLGNWGSLRFYTSRISRWQGTNEHRDEIQWSRSLSDRWSFRLTAAHSRDTGTNERSWELQGQVTYNFFGDTFRHRHNLQASRKRQSLYSMIGGNPERQYGDWMISHNHVRNDDNTERTNDNLRGFFRYRHHRFQTYYTGEIGDFGDQNDIKHTFNFDTAIAFVGDEWALGQPILNSFALVTPDEKLGKIKIKALHSDLAYNSSENMAALVPALRPYHPSYIYVEALSDKILLELPPFLVLPHHRSGFLLEAKNSIGEGGSAGVSGILLDHKNVPIKYKALFITKTNEEETDPLISFSNVDGSFIISGITPGSQYRIHLGRHGKMDTSSDQPYFEFKVPKDLENFHHHDLEKLTPLNTSEIEFLEEQKRLAKSKITKAKPKPPLKTKAVVTKKIKPKQPTVKEKIIVSTKPTQIVETKTFIKKTYKLPPRHQKALIPYRFLIEEKEGTISIPVIEQIIVPYRFMIELPNKNFERLYRTWELQHRWSPARTIHIHTPLFRNTKKMPLSPKQQSQGPASPSNNYRKVALRLYSYFPFFIPNKLLFLKTQQPQPLKDRLLWKKIKPDQWTVEVDAYYWKAPEDFKLSTSTLNKKFHSYLFWKRRQRQSLTQPPISEISFKHLSDRISHQEPENMHRTSKQLLSWIKMTTAFWVFDAQKLMPTPVIIKEVQQLTCISQVRTTIRQHQQLKSRLSKLGLPKPYLWAFPDGQQGNIVLTRPHNNHRLQLLQQTRLIGSNFRKCVLKKHSEKWRSKHERY